MPQVPEILGPGSCQGCCAGTRIEVVQSRVSLSRSPSSVGDGIGGCSVHSAPCISLPASVGAWNLYVPLRADSAASGWLTCHRHASSCPPSLSSPMYELCYGWSDFVLMDVIELLPQDGLHPIMVLSASYISVFSSLICQVLGVGAQERYMYPESGSTTADEHCLV